MYLSRFSSFRNLLLAFLFKFFPNLSRNHVHAGGGLLLFGKNRGLCLPLPESQCPLRESFAQYFHTSTPGVEV